MTRKRDHTSSLSQTSTELDQTPSKRAKVNLPDMETITFDEDGDLYLILLAKALPLPDPTVSPPSSQSSSAGKEVRMLVSSKHMIFASPVFKAMLQGGRFKEGQELAKSTNPIEIPLPDDDADTFTILVNIIHGYLSKVPSTMDIEGLLKLAILVDKYQMQEITSFCFDLWAARQPSEIPTTPFDLELTLSWITVYWISGNARGFKQTTKHLQEGADENHLRLMAYHSLPFPQAITEPLQIWRLATLNKAIIELEAVVQKVQNTTQPCPVPMCDPLVFGSIVKQAAAHLLYPPPAKVSAEWSLEFVLSKLRGISVPICNHRAVGARAPVTCTSEHKALLRTLISSVENEITGLELAQYKSDKKRS